MTRAEIEALARRLDDEQWRHLEMCSWRMDWPPITSETREALLAYRDEVARGLTQSQRERLLGAPDEPTEQYNWPDSGSASGCVRRLNRKGLVVGARIVGRYTRTPFGRAVARALEGGGR